LASDTTIAPVAGGVPLTTVGVWGPAAVTGVTVYEVMGLPPDAGAVQDTVADPLPPVACTPTGADGAVTVP
jgi:hypothetical protein